MARSRRTPTRPTRSQPTEPEEHAPQAAARANQLAMAAVLAVVGLAWLWFFLTTDVARLRRPALLSLILIPEQLPQMWLGGNQPNGLLDRLPIALVTAAILLAAHQAGMLLLRLLRLQGMLVGLERHALATGAGLNLVSLFTLLVGIAGWFPNRWLIVGPIAVGAVAGAIELVRSVIQHVRTTETAAGDAPGFSRSSMAALVFIVLLCAMTLLGAVLPPWEFDVREYHLQVPKEWWRQGSVTFLPHNIYGNMPLGAEMLAAAAMAFFPGDDGWWYGALAGKLTMACYVPLTALLLYSAGRRWFSRAVGVWGAAIYVAQPWVVHTATCGLNEPAVAFHVLAALYVVSLSPLSKPVALLAGFFAGAAAACKYPAVLYAVLPLGLLIFARRDGATTLAISAAERVQTFFRHLAPGPRWMIALCFGLGVLVGGGPWYAKNAALTGNPVYPLAYSVFGGASRTPAKNEQWELAHQVPRNAAGYRYSFAQLRDSLRSLFLTDQFASPLLLPLLLLAGAIAVTRKLKPQPEDEPPRAGNTFASAAIVLLIFITAVWWLATHRIDRFWVPATPLAALLAAGVIDLVEDRSRRLIVMAFMFLGLAYGALMAASPIPGQGENRWFVALSALRDDDDSPRGFSRVEAAHRWLNENTPPGSAVLLVGNATPFDLQPTTYYNTCFDDCLLADWAENRSPSERRKELERRNIAFVSVDWSEISRYVSPGNYGYDPRWSPQLLQQLIDEQLLVPEAVLADDGLTLVPAAKLPARPGELRNTIYRVAPRITR